MINQLVFFDQNFIKVSKRYNIIDPHKGHCVYNEFNGDNAFPNTY